MSFMPPFHASGAKLQAAFVASCGAVFAGIQ